MPKSKSHTVVTHQVEKLVIEIDQKAIDHKVRRPSVPGTRLHRNKTQYTRKHKHPKKTEE